MPTPKEFLISIGHYEPIGAAARTAFSAFALGATVNAPVQDTESTLRGLAASYETERAAPKPAKSKPWTEYSSDELVALRQNDRDSYDALIQRTFGG